MRSFIFHNPGRLVFGKGAVEKRLARELSDLGGSRAFVVSDKALSKSEMIERVKAALGDKLVGFFSGVEPDPGIEIIDRAAAEARAVEADCVVSVGGGSSIDTGKAVAALVASGTASVRELIGFAKLSRRPALHLALPTTAGTGSECTSMSVLKDREAGKKVLILDPRLVPDLGLLDPTLTLGLPPRLTAATGMDAMTHAAEAIMSIKAMPPADALALHAVSAITEHLPRVIEDGADLEARGMMLIAAAEAGQAFTNAYVGVVHALAHALGGMFGVPHGEANAMLLWVGMEFNASVVPERVALIGKAMGIEPSGDAARDADRAVAAMREFTVKTGLPLKLGDYGVDQERLSELSALALSDTSLGTSPRKPESAKELEELYRKCGWFHETDNRRGRRK